MKFQDDPEENLVEPWSHMTRALVICAIFWALALFLVFSTSCSLSLHPDGTESMDFNALQAIQAVEELHRVENQK